MILGRLNFPGGVHTPLMSAETQGVIVVDHANVRGGFLQWGEPVRIELKEGESNGHPGR